MHMGMVHRMVVESCSDYFLQMRRRVYQTPRSFLSFMGSYKAFASHTTSAFSPTLPFTVNVSFAGDQVLPRRGCYDGPSEDISTLGESSKKGLRLHLFRFSSNVPDRRVIRRTNPTNAAYVVCSFYCTIRMPQDQYLMKKEEVDVKSRRVMVGLGKLKKGADDVELMKV